MRATAQPESGSRSEGSSHGMADAMSQIRCPARCMAGASRRSGKHRSDVRLGAWAGCFQSSRNVANETTTAIDPRNSDRQPGRAKAPADRLDDIALLGQVL